VHGLLLVGRRAETGGGRHVLEELGHGQRIWDVLRVFAEPGGAAALGALLSGAYVRIPGEKVGLVLCGANTNAVKFG